MEISFRVRVCTLSLTSRPNVSAIGFGTMGVLSLTLVAVVFSQTGIGAFYGKTERGLYSNALTYVGMTSC